MDKHIYIFSFTRRSDRRVGKGYPKRFFIFSAVVPCLRRRPCYSILSPPDFEPARPKKGDRYEQPKGYSLNAALTTTSCRRLPIFTSSTKVAS